MAAMWTRNNAKQITFFQTRGFLPPPLHVCSVFTLRTRKDHGEWISEKKSIVIPNAYIGGGVVCTKKYVCSVWLWYLVINIHLYKTDFIFLGVGGGIFLFEFPYYWGNDEIFHQTKENFKFRRTCSSVTTEIGG